MKKIIIYGILVALLVTSFAIFGIELNQFLEDTTSIDTIADSVYVDDSSIGIETDSEGTSFEGNIAFFESNIAYDTIYDDDTTGDGYRDRRSYYLENDMVFASWDENADWNYETSMKIVDGMYVESQLSDNNNDGIIDTIATFSNDGEELFAESDLMNYKDIIHRENLYARELSGETIFWIALPLIFGFVFLIILIILLSKSKKASSITSLLLCLIMIIVTLVDPVYATGLYNDDGSVNQEVFEKDWEKYSDIDDRIPLNERSYEAKEYGKAEQEVRRLYSLMYQTAANQELNRLNYIDLAEYKKAVATTHKKNLIKSTIRLAAFTGYTIKDSVGKGKTFASNILKSGATLVTQLGDVMTVTSDFVTDSYKESFGTLQKVYKYGTSDDAIKEIFDDMKNEVKDQVSIKIDETIDDAIGRKRIPDYTVDDLKISDDDVKILKSHYDKSRELDNAILQNRKTNTAYENKIDTIVENIQLEMNKLDEFRLAEKDRVLYILNQNPPEDSTQDDGESIGLLDQTTSDEDEDWEDDGFFSDDYSDEIDISWLDDIEIIDEDTSDDTATNIDLNDRILGNWSGIKVNTDLTISDQYSETEKQALRRYIGASKETNYTITKVDDQYFINTGTDLVEIFIDRNMVYYTIILNFEDESIQCICEYSGTINEAGTKLVINEWINNWPIVVSGEINFFEIGMNIEVTKD